MTMAIDKKAMRNRVTILHFGIKSTWKKYCTMSGEIKANTAPSSLIAKGWSIKKNAKKYYTISN